MTALSEYLNLLCHAWEAKLLHAKRFLTYHTHLIVLCVYPEKYIHAPASPEPGLSRSLRTIARWLFGMFKTNFSSM